MLHLDKGQSAPSLSGLKSGKCSSRAWRRLHLPGFVSHLHLLVLQSARNQHPPGTILPLLTLTEGAVAGLGRNQTMEYSFRLLFANNLKVEHVRHSHCATPSPTPPSLWLVIATLRRLLRKKRRRTPSRQP